MGAAPGRPATGPYGGTHGERLEHLARGAGLKVEWSAGAREIRDSGRHHIDRRQIPPGPGKSCLEALWELTEWPFEPVLEEGALRILTREEAEGFWETWVSAARGK